MTHRRHPAEVTSDRLADHLDRYPAPGLVRDAIGLVRYWLDSIADPPADIPTRPGAHGAVPSAGRIPA